MDFQTIRAGLATRLATISGLNTYANPPGSITAPAAVVLMDGDFINYHTAMGGDTFDLQFTVRLLVARTLDSLSQANLDAYLAPTGASSIKAAIEGGSVSGCDYATVARARGYGGTYLVGEVPYFGCEFVVEVSAS